MSFARWIAVLILLLPAPLRAGAWPRERGTGFASAAIRLSWPQDISTWTSREPTGQYYTLYAEYGLPRRLTLGLDLGRSVSGAGKSVIFLRLPVLDNDRPLKLSTELGLGQIDGETVLRPGISVGYGMERGWLSADGLAEYQLATGQADLKLDLTLGLNMAGDRKLILQVQSGLPHGDPHFLRVAPSVVLPLRDRIRVELGGAWGVVGDTSMQVLMGLWTEF